MQKFTLLIQGKINDETFKLWIKNYKDWKVVVSVWEDEDILKFDIPIKWKVILNTYPKKRFASAGNLDYQIITTINGLKNINTEFVVKVRADEFWSNLELVSNLVKDNQNKIVSSSMFFREWGLYKYHCGDKILAGKKENLLLMFNIAYNIAKENVLSTTVPETHLGLGYLVGKKEIIFDEKFILYTNNKDTKFDKDTLFEAIQSASKAISKNFNFIMRNQKNIEMDEISKKLVHCKEILDYCSSYNDLVNRFAGSVEYDEKELMKKHFEIIDINNLQPYIATRNYDDERGRVWYRNDFNNKEENCLENLN